MKLERFIGALSENHLLVSTNGESTKALCNEITGITYNSKNVKPGFIFICKGAHFKKQYLVDAINNGACCYFSETSYDIGPDFPAVIVNDIRFAMPILSKLFYGDLSKEIGMIGITGTKGKSTTTYLTRQILNDYMESIGQNPVAVCSGIENYDGVSLVESHLTTPENLELYEHMNNAINSGISHMVMEVSSQALKYGRVSGIDYEVGCFLNIGQDHISPIEHSDYGDYFHSKLRILDSCRIACINLDCKEQGALRKKASNCKRVLTFSQKSKDANIFADNIESDDGHVSFDLIVSNVNGYESISDEKDNRSVSTHIELAVFGTINIENALASSAIAVALDVPLEFIKSGLIKAVAPGRMEVFRSYDSTKIVLVDYAHNALSYEALFKSIKKEFPTRDLVIVFGCAGGKALSRREALGELAGRYCKKTYLTEEDCGEEDCMSICEEISKYVAKTGGDYEIVVDRVKALSKAIEEADESVIVIAAGKGREKTQKRGTEYVTVPSDVEVTMQSLF